MTVKRSTRAAAAFAAVAALTGPVAHAAPAPKAEPAALSGQQVEDRVVALVGAGKCGAAQDEATRGGQAQLAQQVSLMCGAKPQSGGGGASGGGAKSRGRSGGGAPSSRGG